MIEEKLNELRSNLSDLTCDEEKKKNPERQEKLTNLALEIAGIGFRHFNGELLEAILNVSKAIIKLEDEIYLEGNKEQSND